jgi:hypothetical protein
MVTEARSNYSCEARISLSLPSVPTCFSNPSLAICGGQLLPLWSTRNLDAKFQSNACFPEELHLPSHDIFASLPHFLLLSKLVTCRAVYSPSHFVPLNSSPRLQLRDPDAYPFIIATGEPSPGNLIAQGIVCI